MGSKRLLSGIVVGLFLTFSVFGQNTPSDVRDLVGDRASSAESRLRDRGYSLVRSSRDVNRSWATWWNDGRNVCITVRTRNGRYESITRTSSEDCNRGQGEWGTGNAPSWAVGTFYAPHPEYGGVITLTVDRNGSVRSEYNGAVSYGNIYGNHLYMEGVSVRVSDTNNGIRTRRIDTGQIVEYSRRRPEGPVWGGGTGNAPSWAIGTFYGRHPQYGGTITLTINRNGRVQSAYHGAVSVGTINGNDLFMEGVTARVSRIRNGIRTSRADTGETVEYYRTNEGGGWGGNQPVNVSDLVGVPASSGESQMRLRGFRNADSRRSGDTRYTIWWRSQSRQCIQSTTVDGRYDALTDIGQHPRCN